MDGRNIALHIVAIGGIAVMTVVLTYPLILHLTIYIPYHRYLEQSAGDHWVFMWAFGFVERMVVELKQWPFFTDALYYPHGLDLTYPLLFGMGLPLAVSIPFVHVLGVIPTYNLFIFSAFILTGYVMFLLVRYLTRDSRAAFVSAIIFAFSPYHMMRAVGHFNFATSGMWIPLYALFFLKAMRDGHILDVIIVPFVLALAFAASPYYAIFLGFFTVTYMIYSIISCRDSSLKRALLRRLCFMVGLVLFLFLPVVWVLLTHAERESQLYSPLAESSRWGADLLAFFVPSTHHSLWANFVRPFYNRFYAHAGNDTEQTVYIGYVVLALAVVAIIKAPKAETRFWLVAALTFFELSLGPFLHIYGSDTLVLHGLELSLPLPNILLHIIPGLNAIRSSSRFSVMLMLAMAVLAGYGTRQLLQQLKGRAGSALFCLCLIVAAIAGEFLIAPVPLVDARIPRIYEWIALEREKDGTLLDVPLHWSISKYEYYQVTHRKRLLLGHVPRLSASFFSSYADNVPFMRLFKNPELIQNYEQVPADKRDVLPFIAFFDLSWIVIHKNYLWPETFDHLMRFLSANFPIAQMAQEGDIVALQLARDTHHVADLGERAGYIVDFGSTTPQLFIGDGWSIPERWADLTVAWAEAEESRLWLFFPRADDFVMELRLLPIKAPGAPPQTVKVYVNARLLGEIELDSNGWRSYTLHLPRTYLTAGINTFRFVYRYTAIPSESLDTRRLAVAFDFIAFRPE
jgi:hypothetical protein